MFALISAVASNEGGEQRIDSAPWSVEAHQSSSDPTVTPTGTPRGSVAVPAFSGVTSGTFTPTQSTLLATPTEIATATPTEPPILPSATATPAPRWSDGVALSELAVLEILPNATSRANDLSDKGSWVYVPFLLTRPDSVTVGSDTGVIFLSYHYNISSKESEVVTYGAGAAFNASRALFANPRVQTVTVEIRSDFVDQLGNTLAKRSSMITLKRSTANKIDWNGLRKMVLADNKHLYCAADGWYLHGIVYDELKDRGCLMNAQGKRLSQ